MQKTKVGIGSLLLVTLLVSSLTFVFGRITAPNSDHDTQVSHLGDVEPYQAGFLDGYTQGVTDALPKDPPSLSMFLDEHFTADSSLLIGTIVTFLDEQTICLTFLDESAGVLCGSLSLFTITEDAELPLGADVVIRQDGELFFLDVFGDTE